MSDIFFPLKKSWKKYDDIYVCMVFNDTQNKIIELIQNLSNTIPT